MDIKRNTSSCRILKCVFLFAIIGTILNVPRYLISRKTVMTTRTVIGGELISSEGSRTVVTHAQYMLHDNNAGPVFNTKMGFNANFSESQARQTTKMKSLKQERDFKTLFYGVDIENEVTNSVLGSPLDVLSNFRNPCWVGKLGSANPYANHTFYKAPELLLSRFKRKLDHNQPFHVRCLPGVFLIGAAKSGSTDLMKNIILHPGIFAPHKEYFYWNRLRLWKPARMSWETFNQKERPTFSEYVDQFDPAAEIIDKQFTEENGVEQHNMITCDGTPHYLYDYDGWEALPGNQGLSEPRYILAHTLRRLIPKARFIIILRDPTDRLYSHFRKYSPIETAELFHQMTVDVLSRWNECVKSDSIRSCAYNRRINPTELSQPGGVCLRCSLYNVFIRDWFGVFPREQFFIIRGEDYYASRTNVLQKLFSFLGLPQLSQDDYNSLEHRKISGAKKGRKIHTNEPMLNETRTLLNGFFKPFNEDLANLMGNDAFLWGK